MYTRRARSLFPFISALPFAFSCSFDFGNVPDGAQITCVTSADCPTGYTCVENSSGNLCVRSENLKEQPKIEGAAAPVPSLLKLGATAVLEFDVNKELGELPDVKVKQATGTMKLDGARSSGKHYVFTYTALEKDPQGTDCPITIRLKDTYGLQSPELSGGVLHFDYVTPIVSSSTMTGSPAKEGALVTFTFTVNKALKAGTDPVVGFAGNSAGAVSEPSLQGNFIKDPSSVPPKYVYTYAAAGSEPQNIPHAVAVDLEDEAGNTNLGIVLGSVEFDFNEPVLKGPGDVKPEYVTRGGYVDFTFEVSEALTADPLVWIDGKAMYKAGNAGLVYTYSYKVDEKDVSGDKKETTVTLTDRAGNVSAGLKGATANYDFDPPGLAGTPVVYPGMKMKGGVEFRLSFTVTKELMEDPDVVISNGSKSISVTKEEPQAGLSYAFKGTTPVDGNSPFYGITVKMTDLAGNFSAKPGGTIELDNVPPAVGSSGGSPDPAGVGKEILYTITPTKLLQQGPESVPPKIHVDPNIDFIGPELTGNTYMWKYTVKDTDVTREYKVTVDMTDTAGNVATGVQAKSFNIDTTYPKVTDYSVKSDNAENTLAKDGDTITAKFTVDKELLGDPLVMLGGKDMTFFSKTGTGPYEYTYKRPASKTSDGDGVKSGSVTVTDRAGNIKSMNIGAVTYDFTGPGVSATTVGPDPAKLGTTLVYTVTPNEELGGDPVLVVKNSTDESKVLAFAYDPIKRGYAYTTAGGANEVDGQYDVTISMTDKAGNPATLSNKTDANIKPVNLMVSQPTVGALNVTGGEEGKGKRFSEVGGFDVVKLSFPIGKEIKGAGGGLSVKIDDKDFAGCTFTKDADPAISGTYGNCQYDVKNGGLDAGSHTINVTATDPAGNNSTKSTTVNFDFTKPVLTMSVVPEGRPAKYDETLTVTVSSSKGLDADGVVLTSDPPLSLVAQEPAGLTYRWTYPVKGTDMLRMHKIKANARDPVGNPADEVKNENVRIDGVAPVVTNITANRTVYSKIKDYLGTNYANLVLTFNCPKDVKATGGLAVKLDALDLTGTCVYTQASGLYTCTYDVSTYDSPEGVKNISVSASDEAGNPAGTGSVMVVLDFTAPSVVTSVASPSPAPAGADFYYSATPSEELITDPLLTFNPSGPPLSLVEMTKASGTYTWEYTVSGASVFSPYDVSVRMVDRTGNTNTGGQGESFIIDSVAPQIALVSLATDNALDPQRATKGDTVTAVFNLNKEPSRLKGPPTAKFGGFPMTCSVGGNPYECTLKIAQTPQVADGDKAVTVNVTDAAGTGADSTFGPIVLDTSSPDVRDRKAVIVLTRPSGCPIQSADLALVTVGTKAEISFYSTKDLHGGRPTKVELRRTGAANMPLEFDSAKSSGRYYTYYRTVTGGDGLATGAYTLYVELTDTTGNASAVGGIVINDGHGLGFAGITSTPDAPSVGIEKKIVYVRIPWGSNATGGNKTFKLVSDPGYIVDATARWVIAYDSSAAATEIGRTNIVGRTFPVVDGEYKMDLAPADRKEIYLRAYDGACNASPIVMVRDVEWTATMNGKAAGSTYENPHRFETRTFFDGVLQRGNGTERGGSDGMAAVGFPWVTAQLGSRWRQRSFADPSIRFNMSAAFDSVRGRMVVFGGCQASGASCPANNDETWEFDGMNWSPAVPTDPELDGNPSSRGRAAMAFDSCRGVTVLHGGSTGEQGFETWEWNGKSWRYRGDTGPFPRYAHAMAFDAKRCVTVLFGGQLSSGYSNETWEWDGETWTDRTFAEASKNPQARSSHGMAYDAANEKVVLFGGISSGTCDGTAYCNATWTWDGEEWIKEAPAASPSGRTGTRLAYDSARRKTVLFGGYTSGNCDGGSSAYCSSVWEWDGGTWAMASPPSAPPGRNQHGFVYDSARGVAVAFGGYVGSYTWTNDTWDWTGRTWVKRGPGDPEGDGNPSARYGAVMAYDAERKNTVLFGGTNDGAAGSNQTWLWGGASWSLASPAAKPGGRFSASASYDTGRKVTTLFGGYGTDCDAVGNYYCTKTWEWNGSDWADKTPASNNPTPRINAAMAHDARRGATVLFGGYRLGAVCDGGASEYCGNTWEWKLWGTPDCASATEPCWKKVATSGPGARLGAAAAYDSRRGVTVVFGGKASAACDAGPLAICDTTWEWNGSFWTNVTPGDGVGIPPRRYGHRMFYDASRGRVMLTGGTDDAVRYSDLWEWNGSVWTKITGTGLDDMAVPSPRDQAGVAYDLLRGVAVLFGGAKNDLGVGSGTADTWELENGAFSRPGQIMMADFDDAGAPVSAVNEIDVKFRAGALATTYGFGPAAGTWNTAVSICSAAYAKGHIATPVTPYDEMAMEEALGSPVNAWIGLTDSAKEGTFVWYDGLPAVFSYWAPGEGGGGSSENCAQTLASTHPFRWADASCSTSLQYVCAGVETNEVALKVWDAGEWKTLDAKSFEPDVPGDLGAVVTDAGRIARLFTGPQKYLNFAVTPKAPSGEGAAAVTVDYAEVTVKYRL